MKVTNGAIRVAALAGFVSLLLGVAPAHQIPVEAAAPAPASVQVVDDSVFAANADVIHVDVADLSGNPITDARATAYNTATGTQVSTTNMAAPGRYNLEVGAGTWTVAIEPANIPIDWAYTGRPRTVRFLADLNQQDTVRFKVTPADSRILGTVTKPDGSFFAPGTVWVWAFTSDGIGSGDFARTDGTFSIPVPAGTYNLRVVPQDQSYEEPTTLAGLSFTTGPGAPADAGTLAMLLETSKIVGEVNGPSGPVSNVTVRGWRRDSSESVSTTTAPDGKYSLGVISGTWDIRPMPADGSGLAYPGNPTVYEMSDNQTRIANFTLVATDAKITGTLVDSSLTPAKVLTDVNGTLIVRGSGGTPGSFYTPIKNGAFDASVPAGNYRFVTWLRPGIDYLQASQLTDPDGIQSTSVPTGVLTLTIPMTPTNSAIAGQFLGPDHNPITGQPGDVRASDGRNGAREWDRLDPSDGSYDLHVFPGTWFVRGFMDPLATGYAVVNDWRTQVLTVTATNTFTSPKVLNLNAVKTSATIRGQITDYKGQPMAGVRVEATQVVTPGILPFKLGVDSGGVGHYELTVPAGTYRIHVRDNINRRAKDGTPQVSPLVQTVTVPENGSKSVDLQFRAADAAIAGQVLYNGAGKSGAFVRAYSATGARGFTTADSSGKYSMKVNGGDTWYVEGIAEDVVSPTITLLASPTYTVATTSGAVANQNLTLQPSLKIPAAVALTFDPTLPQALLLSDGAEIDIPAFALGSSGSVTLRVTPKTRLAKELSVRPVDIGYSFAAYDQNGKPITKFSQDVTIRLPFDPAKLPAGTTPADLQGTFWNEASQTWEPAPNWLVTWTATDHYILVSVNHFTDYAVTVQLSNVQEVTAEMVFLPAALTRYQTGW